MQIYIITGGSKGLGKSMVKQLLSPHRVVYSLSRTEGETGALHLPIDLSQPSKLDGLMEQIFAQYSAQRIDSVTLINNAGLLDPIGQIEKITQEEIVNSIAINITAPIILSSSFIKYSQSFNCKKLVVNISSGAANSPYEGWSLYCSAKASLEHFTRCVAQEQKNSEHPVSMICVNPGVMNTNMQTLIRNTPKDSFPMVEKFHDLFRSGQLPEPEKIAELLIKGITSKNTVSGEVYNVHDF